MYRGVRRNKVYYVCLEKFPVLAAMFIYWAEKRGKKYIIQALTSFFSWLTEEITLFRHQFQIMANLSKVKFAVYLNLQLTTHNVTPTSWISCYDIL